jgi:hypothetical protein
MNVPLTIDLINAMRAAGIDGVHVGARTPADVDIIYEQVRALPSSDDYSHHPYDAVGERHTWRQALVYVSGLTVTITSPHVSLTPTTCARAGQ